MHKRDGDECVHAAAAQHNTPCEQEAVAESVNEEGGRSLKLDGLNTSVRFEPANLNDSSPRREREHTKIGKKQKTPKHLNTTPQKEQRHFIYSLLSVNDPQTENALVAGRLIC